MTNSKATKKALFTSMISLLLCFTMLMGATFAWFTDTVKSTNNIIKSGTLKIAMHWADGTKAVPADESTDWKNAAKGAIFDYSLWEPGYTEVRHIKIENIGSLALKYQLRIVPTGEVSELADVIDVYYLDPAAAIEGRAALKDENKLGTLTEVLGKFNETAQGTLLAKKEGSDEHKDTVTIALKMQESAGNKYQDLAIGSEFAVELYATQLEAEYDSFDNTYDKNADFDGEISTVDALNAAIAKGGTYQLMSSLALDEAVTIPEGVTLALDLGGNTISTASGNAIVNNGALTLSNGTVKADAAYAVANAGSLTIDGATIDGGINNTGYVVVEDGKIFTTRGGSAHAVYHAGTMIEVNGGEFSGNGNEVIYATNSASAIINGGTFDKVEKASYLVRGTRLSIKGGTFYAYDENGADPAAHYAQAVSGIYGGTFNYDPSKTNSVADGYVATNNGDGTWTVVKGVLVSSNTALTDAIADGEDSIYLAPGTYTMPDGSDNTSLRGKTLTISGTKDTVIDVSDVNINDQFVTGATLVFDGVTLNFNSDSSNIYMGFANVDSVTYKNCNITGLQILIADEVNFENCVLDSTGNTAALGQPHSVWTYGAKEVNFTGCEFKYGNRAINCYKDEDIDGGKQVVNLTNCKFTTTDSTSKGAVEINSASMSVGIEVNLTGCTAPAYGEMAYVSEWDSTNGAKTTINIK